MKRLFVVLLLMCFMVGCAGISANVPVSAATDTGFYMVMKANPQYKPVVVASLNSLKVLLGGSMTYDQFIIEIAKAFPGDYSALGVFLSSYMAQDKPTSVTLIPMSQAYKDAIIVKIDRFLLLTNTT
jgi:hypothetical protein